jgi:SPP1 gp7 family putative phage head morphogenesis protein
MDIVDSLEDSVDAIEPEVVEALKSNQVERIAATLATLGIAYSVYQSRAGELAAKMVGTVNQANREGFRSALQWSIGGFQLKDIVLEENIGQALKARVLENTALIQSIPERFHADLSTLLYEEASGGGKGESLASKLQRLYGVTERRAKFIARDQTAKANGSLTEIRQKNLGITSYIWQTAMDERVRPSHAVKHGRKFDWDNPPPDTGHPGQDFNCRCVAIGLVKV